MIFASGQNSPGDYVTVNRQGWSWLATHDCDASLPFGLDQFEEARERLDKNGWLPWGQFQSVLCLACGGGQQGPLFASLGCRVTVVDICPEQLQKDLDVAQAFGLDIECVEADMLDLAVLHARGFDLVYQAVSACYVPDVNRLYAEVRATLKTGGTYFVEHWNPVHMQLAPDGGWDGEAYRLIYPRRPEEPLPWYASGRAIAGRSPSCWHYIHPLHELIGGMCNTGFRIERFAEIADGDVDGSAGSTAHLSRYVAPLLAILARAA
jgi:SAM-dependent methyltransferase